jgi:hypothetical protein
VKKDREGERGREREREMVKKRGRERVEIFLRGSEEK